MKIVFCLVSLFFASFTTELNSRRFDLVEPNAGTCPVESEKTCADYYPECYISGTDCNSDTCFFYSSDQSNTNGCSCGKTVSIAISDGTNQQNIFFCLSTENNEDPCTAVATIAPGYTCISGSCPVGFGETCADHTPQCQLFGTDCDIDTCFDYNTDQSKIDCSCGKAGNIVIMDGINQQTLYYCVSTGNNADPCTAVATIAPGFTCLPPPSGNCPVVSGKTCADYTPQCYIYGTDCDIDRCFAWNADQSKINCNCGKGGNIVITDGKDQQTIYYCVSTGNNADPCAAVATIAPGYTCVPSLAAFVRVPLMMLLIVSLGTVFVL